MVVYLTTMGVCAVMTMGVMVVTFPCISQKYE